MDVVAGILVRGSRILAAKRSASMQWAGFWEFPGGKVEQGETLDEALLREFHEELGITVCDFSLWKIKKKKIRGASIRLFFYLVTYFTGVVVPREGQDIAWLTVTEAQTLTFLPADKELLVELSAVHELL